MRYVTEQREQRRRAADRPCLKEAEEGADIVKVLLEASQPARGLCWLVHFALTPEQRIDSCTAQSDEGPIRLRGKAAGASSDKFLDFVRGRDLWAALEPLDMIQIGTLALFHAGLPLRLPPVQLSRNGEFAMPKACYVPSDDVLSPPQAYFVTAAMRSAPEPGQARIEAPRVCQLCGKGFLNWDAFFGHTVAEHHSYAEYRKRLFFEAEKLDALALPHRRKRTMLANFAFGQTCSAPLAGFGEKDQYTTKQEVACAVCAIQDQMENGVGCFLWRPCPAHLLKQQTVGAAEDDDDDDEQSDAAEAGHEVHGEFARRRMRLLHDSAGYYIGEASEAHRYLNVEAYMASWPLIPKAELHASSVQHPLHAEMRWLLHTRCVPVLSRTPTAGASEDGVLEDRPPCAGIGDIDRKVWLCMPCAASLCCVKLFRPKYGLCNWNWGGRVHPAYKDLSLAMRGLLGLGRPFLRLLVLRYSGAEDEQEKGLVGNTILLAQPSIEQVLAELPPSEQEITKCFSIIFGTDRTDVSKQKALFVQREQYIKCTSLRKSVCPCFANVVIAEDRARATLPENGVPAAIVEAAMHMDTVEHFQPTFVGPASMRDPAALAPEAPDGLHEEGHSCGAAEDVGREDGPEHLASGELSLSSALPDTGLAAEYLIGVDESSGIDAARTFSVFQEKLRIASEELTKMVQAQAESTAPGTDASATSRAADVSASRARHMQVCLDLQALAKEMAAKGGRGKTLEQKLSEAATAMETKSNVLLIKAGQPLDMFAASAWIASFVEFFYGDCAPNLQRPTDITWRELFRYLMRRQELEYHLPDDATNPDIPGGCYRAPRHSRWDTPEFAAIFGDTLRRIQILQTTKGLMQRKDATWKKD